MVVLVVQGDQGDQEVLGVKVLERHHLAAAPDITNMEVLTHIRPQRQPLGPHSVYMMGVLTPHRLEDPLEVLLGWGA